MIDFQHKSFDFQTIPEAFICPISRVFMRDPVISKNGISFQRRAISQWITQNGTNPFTNQKLEITDLTHNEYLYKDIQRYVEQLVRQQKQKLQEIQKNNLQLALGILGKYLIKNRQNNQIGSNFTTAKKHDFSGSLNLAVIFQSLQIDRLSAEIKELLCLLNITNAQIKDQEQKRIEQKKKNASTICLTKQKELHQNPLQSVTLKKYSQKQARNSCFLLNKTLFKNWDTNLKSQTISNISKELQSAQFKITINKNTCSWLQKQYSANGRNVCTQNYNYSDWLRSFQVLPKQGSFYFKFSIIKTQNFAIDFGVIDNAFQSVINETIEVNNLLNSIYYNIAEREVNAPQTIIKFDTADTYLREQPDFLSVYIQRQENKIQWHFNGREQAKYIMPQSWKHKELKAIIKSQSKGFKIAFL